MICFIHFYNPNNYHNAWLISDFQPVFVALESSQHSWCIHVDFLSYEQVQASQQSPVIVHKESEATMV